MLAIQSKVIDSSFFLSFFFNFFIFNERLMMALHKKKILINIKDRKLIVLN